MIDVDIFTQAGFGKVNEDFVCHAELTPGIHAIVVTDGMGGLSFGDDAAKLAAESIISFLKEVGDNSPIENRMSRSLEYANDMICRECKRRKTKMGTSLAVAVINGNICHYSSLGNVRMYIQREKTLRQLTEDHTNAIAGQSYLTRCLNGKPFRYQALVESLELSSGDVLVIATDGYYIYNDVALGNMHSTVNVDDATAVRISVLT